MARVLAKDPVSHPYSEVQGQWGADPGRFWRPASGGGDRLRPASLSCLAGSKTNGLNIASSRFLGFLKLVIFQVADKREQLPAVAAGTSRVS